MKSGIRHLMNNIRCYLIYALDINSTRYDRLLTRPLSNRP